MVEDPVAEVARAVGDQLAEEGYGSELLVEVEGPLYDRHAFMVPEPDPEPEPLRAHAELIVHAATLAWTVYTDLREQRRPPSPEVLARTVRAQLPDPRDVPAAERDRIIQLVAVAVHRHQHSPRPRG